MINPIEEIKKVSTIFDGQIFPNPHKTREDKITELSDHYENVLYGMDDELLDQEYEDRIG